MGEHSVQELLELFLETNDLGRLIEKAAQVLNNPLLICDTSYHFLGRSDVKAVRDKSWLAGVKRGGWSYELVSLINRLDLDYTGKEYKPQILDSINADSSSRRMIGTLCADGIHLGYYFLLEENGSFAQIPEQVYRQVSLVLAKAVSVSRSARMPGSNRSDESVILDLLQNGFDSRSIFLERAGKSDIARLGSYLVFCLLPESSREEMVGLRDLRSIIGQCLPLSWQVEFQSSVVILANFSSRSRLGPDALDALDRVMVGQKLRAGFSDYFSDPYELKRYFEQARAAAHLGRTFEDSRRVVPYEDYKIYNLFHSVPDEDLFTQYSTEIVRRIREYDRKSATQYLETIYYYLGSGCSVHKAAEKLYVHRNTVAYRVARAKELFGIDFEDAQKNHMNYMSCLLRRYCDCIRQPIKQSNGKMEGNAPK